MLIWLKNVENDLLCKLDKLLYFYKCLNYKK